MLIMFVARPISVFVATLATKLNWKEKLFIAWIGPRGIVAASVASLFAFTLVDVGVEEGERLLALTFLAIMMTVTIQGLTASSVSRLLGVHTLEGRKAIIVGASPLARAIAKAIKENGRPIALVDTNQMMVELAQQQGLEAYHGNALEDELLEQTDIDEAETLLAVTANSEVNVLVAQMAHDNFGIRRAYPSIKNPERGANLKLLKRTGGKLAFGRPVDILAWEYASGRIEKIEMEAPANWNNKVVAAFEFPDEIIPILSIRGNSTEVVHADQIWQVGDRVIFLTNTSPEKAASKLTTSV